MTDGKGQPSPFATFCYDRMKRALLPASKSIPHHMVAFGIENEGNDVRYFADQGYSVEAVDETVVIGDYQAEPCPGYVRHFHMNPDSYFRRKIVQQSSVHSVYMRRLFERVAPDKRQEVLMDVRYMLRPGGWYMLEVSTDRRRNKSIVDGQALLKRFLVEASFRPLYFDVDNFGNEAEPFIARFILER